MGAFGRNGLEAPDGCAVGLKAENCSTRQAAGKSSAEKHRALPRRPKNGKRRFLVSHLTWSTFDLEHGFPA